ncbi:MAG: hypothetical protein EOO88_00110 [Pedobacter sp.]|nr:MAG: hypothetical protein EOO88_00110 [Pedobacter sp.]
MESNNTYRTVAGYFLLLLTVTFFGCEKTLLGEDPSRDAKSSLQAMYQQFDQHYGMFEVKNIDWDALYDAKKGTIGAQSTDRELYNAMIAMLSPLNDAHVTLYPAEQSGLATWSIDLNGEGVFVNDFFDLKVIKDHYIGQLKSTGPFDYGMFGKLGYLHIREFPDQKFSAHGKALDQIFSELKTAKGLILDIRDNAGGADPVAQYVAGRFASTQGPYMHVRKKNGAGKGKFSDWTTWEIQPTGETFTRPIALLTEKGTQSAAETFTLALKTQQHVRSFGGKTAGAFSDNILKELPNGWLISISVGDYRDKNRASHEGIGLLPDVPLSSSRAELVTGKDRVLEAAATYLNNK